MRWVPGVALLILAAALAGCEAAGPTATSTPEQGLRIRAEAAYAASLEGDWLEQYQYTSPRSRSVCEFSGYRDRLMNFVDIIRRFMALSEDATVEFRVRDAEEAGAEGTIYIEYFSDGQLINVGDPGRRRWVLLNGDWWEEHEAWRDGCVGWKLFE